MHQIVQMIDLYSGKYNHRLKKVCEPLFKTFGINYFFHQSVTSDGQFHVIGTYPDFMHDYGEQNYHLYNPFIMGFEKLKSGIYLYDSIDDDTFQTTLNRVSKKYNLKHSLILMEKNANRCDQYGFTIPTNSSHSSNIVINEMPLFKQFIDYFKNECSIFIKELQENPVILTKEIEKSYISLKDNQFDHTKRVEFLNDIHRIHRSFSTITLSNREKECLRYCLEGKSASQIADILFLSNRTVEHYLEQLKDKFLCERKSELIGLLHQIKKLGLYPELFDERYQVSPKCS